MIRVGVTTTTTTATTETRKIKACVPVTSSLLQVPCSRVGHVYRQLSPHSLPTDGSAVGRMRAKADNVVVNTARFAEAWLDQPYRSFYYYMNPGEVLPEIKQTA